MRNSLRGLSERRGTVNCEYDGVTEGLPGISLWTAQNEGGSTSGSGISLSIDGRTETEELRLVLEFHLHEVSRGLLQQFDRIARGDGTSHCGDAGLERSWTTS